MPKDEFTTRRLHRCSFCYKTQDQVRRLVAGPDVYICDECIKLCYDIIADDVTPHEHRRARFALPAAALRNEGRAG